MTVEVAILADDLTGALDGAAPFVRAGRTAVVATAPAWLDGADIAADVIAVSTSTRDAGADDAARIVGSAARSLAALAPRILFKKIDSTLRGHVVAETMSMLAATGRGRAIVCPAVPAQGRIVRDGRVLVHGTPVADWLPPGEAQRWGCAGPLPAMFAAESTVGLEITCCDAESDEDLGHIARTVRAGGDALLAVGAAGLAAALAGEGAHRPVALDGPVLFVIGSRTRETAEQVARAAAMEGTMVVAVDGSGRPSPPVAPGTRAVLLVADAAVIAPGTDAPTVAGWLARTAREMIGRFPPRTIVLSGGDTAHAVLDHLGCGVLRIVGEVEPGVPVAEVDLGGGTTRIVTKAGGFGGPGLFVRIATSQ
jgi:uncharacterized protein YgbK (DUF1537 family)